MRSRHVALCCMTQQDELFEAPTPRKRQKRTASRSGESPSPEQLTFNFPSEVPADFEPPSKDFLVYLNLQIARRAMDLNELQAAIKASDIIAKLQGHYAPKQVDVNDITPKSREDHERELARYGVNPDAIIDKVMQH